MKRELQLGDVTWDHTGVITPEEFEELIAVVMCETVPDSYDAEYAHMYADKVMCRVLRELGYGAGIDIFEMRTKWYA